MSKRLFTFALWVPLLAAGIRANAETDQLPSWNDGAAKKAIVEFVQATTTQGSRKFVPPAERIATFDQDALDPGVHLGLQADRHRRHPALPPEEREAIDEMIARLRGADAPGEAKGRAVQAREATKTVKKDVSPPEDGGE